MSLSFPFQFPPQVAWRDDDMDHSQGWYNLPPGWSDFDLGTILELEQPYYSRGEFYPYAVVIGKKEEGGKIKLLLQEGFTTSETAHSWWQNRPREPNK